MFANGEPLAEMYFPAVGSYQQAAVGPESLDISTVIGRIVGMYAIMRYYAMEAGAMGSERFCVGLDLGQAVDRTAICVMSRIDNPSLADVREEHFRPA
jgi:hypothetical protein